MKKKHIEIIIVVIAFIFVGIIGTFVICSIIDRATPKYEIVSNNGVTNIESVYPEVRYNYTVYAKIKNVRGDSTPITFYCELTRENLETITKQQTISLARGEIQTLEFFFSNEDLEGKIPIQYKIHAS